MLAHIFAYCSEEFTGSSLVGLITWNLLDIGRFFPIPVIGNKIVKNIIKYISIINSKGKS